MKNDLAVLTKRSISDIIIIELIKIHEVIIMGVGSWIVAILVFIVAAVLMVLAVRHFMEQGYLLNNAYIYASNEERASMNKKPYYRQSAIVFCLLSVVFSVIGISLVFQNSKIMLLEIPLLLGVAVYAIVSSHHNTQS